MTDLAMPQPYRLVSAASNAPHPVVRIAGEGIQRAFADPSRETTLAIRRLGALHVGWAGDGSVAVSTRTLATALRFNSGLWFWGARPKVGPGEAGEVVLEWDLPSGRSLYCRVLGNAVEMVAFDSTNDILDVSLPADAAAQVAKVLLEHI